MTPPENKIIKHKNYLLLIENNYLNTNITYLKENFCGQIINTLAELPTNISEIRIFACGDISEIEDCNLPIFVIKECSINASTNLGVNFTEVSFLYVPILIHQAGVYYRRLFKEADYFYKIKSEHEFQELTESNKGGISFRKGIYLSEITKEEGCTKEEVLHFNLLRCSSNFKGPTDNFRATDYAIISKINSELPFIFEHDIKLNHVLAQIYENKFKSDETTKEKKAKIKAHSDKTKDMPKHGLIAFCTFYNDLDIANLKPSTTDIFDLCINNVSVLTRLEFKLKEGVTDETKAKEFTVVLYPNSVFIIPLSTNRLYTHEIKPSVLSIDKIPTRLGYVVRCSNLEAKYMNNQTFIKENGQYLPLEQMTDEPFENLKDSYVQENKTEKEIEYGKVNFSMNTGDYLKPNY